MTQLFGVYVGVVTGGGDPARQGRVRVTIPSVPGAGTLWARVCAGPGGRTGGEAVVAFEAGDASRPIVLGFL
jgi:Type VI secretion system/phage-baseplate injector OB domain